MYIHISFSLVVMTLFGVLLIGLDFRADSLVVTIPAMVKTFVIPEGVVAVVDDNINEIEQHFALVAVIGVDAPRQFVCFQARGAKCLGSSGATQIQIIDNDRMILDVLLKSIHIHQKLWLTKSQTPDKLRN